MEPDIRKFLEVAINASIEAGEEIIKVYHENNIGIEIKEDDSPLTLADLNSNRVITDYLNDTPYPILSEEGRSVEYSERKNWRSLWIVDPLDGTKEFIKRNGEFTVNIALIHDQLPLLGVVYAPVTKELFFAGKDIGAYKIVLKEAAKVCLNDMLLDADALPLERPSDHIFTVVASRSHLSDETVEFIEELKQKHGEVNAFSRGSSLKLCMVAEGKADCYPRFAPTMEWDTAAGHAICKYSGAEVIDWETQCEMIYNREKLLNNWFLVRRYN